MCVSHYPLPGDLMRVIKVHKRRLKFDAGTCSEVTDIYLYMTSCVRGGYNIHNVESRVAN